MILVCFPWTRAVRLRGPQGWSERPAVCGEASQYYFPHTKIMGDVESFWAKWAGKGQAYVIYCCLFGVPTNRWVCLERRFEGNPTFWEFQIENATFWEYQNEKEYFEMPTKLRMCSLRIPTIWECGQFENTTFWECGQFENTSFWESGQFENAKKFESYNYRASKVYLWPTSQSVVCRSP